MRILFLFIAIAGLAILFGVWSRHNSTSSEQGGVSAVKTATIFDKPRFIAPFQMVDANNKPFTQDNFKGHYSLVFFGFTNCPMLCPTTLAMLNKAYKMMQDDKLKDLPQIVFISVDPDRDSPAAIKKYLLSFNPAFLGAAGNKETIDKLTQEMNVLYQQVPDPQKQGNYTFDHSGAIILVNPQGQYQGVFTTPHDPRKIADDMKALTG